MGFAYEKRHDYKTVVSLNKSQIHTGARARVVCVGGGDGGGGGLTRAGARARVGDVFAINRFDSTSMFIDVGTGARIGHVAVAVWNNSDVRARRVRVRRPR